MPIGDRQHDRRDQADMGQDQRERQDAEDRGPDHVLAAEAVADRPADQGADRDANEEHEEEDLRGLHRHAEAVDQVEGVVAA